MSAVYLDRTAGLGTIRRRVVLGALLLFAVRPSGLISQSAVAPSDRDVVYAAEVDAIIHPVSAEYMIETMERADRAGAALVVFTLRTPGGLLDSTRSIVTRMLGAATPIVVFVAPPGSRAASAGFVITIAADVAAMAHGTHIGAAHPVAATGQQADETTAKKATEDTAAYVRTIAAGRGRNVALAEQAVVESRAFTEEEALAASPPLIDLVAADLSDLLAKLDGRKIRRFDGSTAVLHTAGASVTAVEMTQRQRILSAIAHPNIAYILLSLGILGLTIELWAPGSVVPGVVGAVCLLLAFFALQVLPVNYAGLLLIVVGLIMLALEIKVTSYGLLTIGGAASLLLGSLILFDSSAPELRLSLRFVLPIVATLVGIAATLVWLGVAAQRAPALGGAAGMIGLSGRALTPIGPGTQGRVSVRGETWQATADRLISEGTRVQVTNIEGLTLTVRPE
jgi:membrane-bound serine protease (ClpP class)